MNHAPELSAQRRTRYTIVLWLLAVLFALRVAGQAVQHWTPQTWLPPAAVFQGSDLPYGWLLASQMAILLLMLRGAWRVQAGAQALPRPLNRTLAWFGLIYMTGAIGRIFIGLVVADAPAWFRTWIPALFHLVLAGYVLTLFAYYRRLEPVLDEGAQ